mmetsp:Transcript_18902/g.61652  ORF Transcript_18902/g.61652 Transcript_18902/m.61652 type:complete len:292 (-) Transcript_18902:881-1756(-)
MWSRRWTMAAGRSKCAGLLLFLESSLEDAGPVAPGALPIAGHARWAGRLRVVAKQRTEGAADGALGDGGRAGEGRAPRAALRRARDGVAAEEPARRPVRQPVEDVVLVEVGRVRGARAGGRVAVGLGARRRRRRRRRLGRGGRREASPAHARRIGARVHRAGSGVADAAHVDAALEQPVAVVAPRDAPRVLDLPVVDAARVGAEAHHEHRVVLHARGAAVEDAARVVLHRGRVGVDRHHHRAVLVHGRDEVVLRGDEAEAAHRQRGAGGAVGDGGGVARARVAGRGGRKRQ